MFIAPFFVNCISEQDLDEMNIEIVRNTLYKVTFLLNPLLIFTLKITGNSQYCKTSPTK